MNTKRFLAVALSATMVFGSTLTAFAEDPDPTEQATGGGNGTGAGSTEGYVNTLKTKVLVPTEEAINAGLNFHVDPQRLITATSKAAHPDWTLPETGDTGVYFLTGDKTYTNTSSTFNIANLGTGDVTFTIKVEAAASETPTTDIPFDTKANVTAEDPTAAKLYIGALIGKEATAVAVSSTAIEKDVILAGKLDNYEYTYDAEDGYDYVIKSGENTWNAVPISFEGAITNFATDKTVPGVKLTYSWKAKADGDTSDQNVTIDTAYKATAAPAAANYISATGVSSTSKTVSFAAGEGVTVTGVKLTLTSGDIDLVSGNQYNVSGNNITFTKYGTGWVGGTLTVTFSDGETDTLTCE